MKFYYSHGRIAFKYGLKYLGISKEDKLMLPNYLCDVLLEPLNDLGIKPIFYEINDDFTVNLKSIKESFDKKVKAILLINFFGFEDNKKKIYTFCKKKKLFLIEDNCHLLKKNFKSKNKMSDIVFYSSRKFIKNSYSGSILEILNKKRSFKILNKNLENYPVSLFNKINSFLENNLLILKRFFKYLFLKMPDYENIIGIKNEKIYKDYKIDNKSFSILQKYDFRKIKKERLENYIKWKKFCLKYSIEPINRKLQKNAIPWLLPVFVSDQALKRKLFKYGWREGFVIISWPSLPKNLINKKTTKIWKKLICFDTERAPRSLESINL